MKRQKSKKTIANQSEFAFTVHNLGSAPKQAENGRAQRPACFADKLPSWLREPIKRVPKPKIII
jgi:hypothetical protein